MGCAGFWVDPNSTSASGSGSTNTGNYVYVANQGSGTLSGFAIGSGTLTQVSGSPYSLNFAPSFIPTAVAVNPANTMVFVAGTSIAVGSNYIAAYSIGAGGALTLLAPNPVLAQDEQSIDISKDGNWLVGLDSAETLLSPPVALVDLYQITTSGSQMGTLAYQKQGSASVQYQSGITLSANQIRFDPNEEYIFAALGSGGDLVFPFGNGALGTATAYSTGASDSDQALAVSPGGAYLYIARSGATGSNIPGVGAFSIGANGSLTGLSPTTFFSAAQRPTSVAINPAGTDVYVANQLGQSISEYSVGSGGVLTAIGGSPLPATASPPYIVAVDSSGAYLLSISQSGSADLSMYSIGSTGGLSLVSTAATGTTPIAMATTH